MNREKINLVLDAMEKIESLCRPHVDIRPNDLIDIWAFTDGASDDKRHKILAALTPLVGKLEAKLHDGRETWFEGESDGISVKFVRASVCKILGYKTEKKSVQKQINEPEYETIIEEVQIPITDCDIRTGKFKEEEIEVPA